MNRHIESIESGVEWIGKIPRDWGLSRIDSLFFRRREKNTNIVSDNILSVLKDRGVIRYEDKGNIGNKVSDNIENYQLVHAGDIVVNNMNVTIGSVGRSDQFGALSGIYIVLAAKRADIDMSYYDYVFKIRPFQRSLIQISSGLLEIREALNFIQFKALKLPTPSLPEQTQIAAFLDRKTGQIDELIRVKERKIALLQEQRTALINQAVTKGLDPNVEMKSSGVEWIGEIPEHWETKKLGHVSTIFKGGTPKRNVDRYFEGNLPWARPVDITGLNGALYINDTGIHISEEALGNSGARLLPAGTVLLTSRATLGETAITTVPMATNQGFANFVCNRQLLNVYLVYYLRAIKDLLVSLGSGSTFLEVTKGTLIRVGIPLPPLSEQSEIADFLNQKNTQIDELISEEQRSIELLKEYRQSLISDAVTGKIHVRNEV